MFLCFGFMHFLQRDETFKGHRKLSKNTHNLQPIGRKKKLLHEIHFLTFFVGNILHENTNEKVLKLKKKKKVTIKFKTLLHFCIFPLSFLSSFISNYSEGFKETPELDKCRQS